MQIFDAPIIPPAATVTSALQSFVLLVALSTVAITIEQTLEYALRDKNDRFWASLPTVGVPDTWFLPWTRAALAAITDSSKTALEGYARYCKKNILFAVPSTGVGAVVILPPGQLDLLNRSETQLEAFGPQIENIQPRYTIGDEGLYKNLLHFEIVRQYMIKDVGNFASPCAEEVDVAFRHVWGEREDVWTEVAAFDSASRIISQASNRTFFGLPLCRNEHFLEATRMYANAVYIGSALITTLPMSVRPLLGHLIALPAKYYLAQTKKLLVPVIQERVKLWESSGEEQKQPNDAIQWMIERCAKAGGKEMDPARIAQRLLILDLVSVYTTAYAFANSVIDIYSSDDSEDTIAGLRAEISQVVEKHGDLSTKAAIDELYRVDSAVRESMRISAFGIVTLTRIVGEAGFDIDLGPDNTHHIPAGVRVGIPSQAIHQDPEFHDNPLKFDAFRFSRPFEGPDARKSQRDQQRLSVDCDKTFLTYGYGKHACPGRWFASQVMKQALAYMLYNYDVECIGGRPEKKAVLNMIMPPTEARLRMRRRKTSM